jgi:hypothetical protein
MVTVRAKSSGSKVALTPAQKDTNDAGQKSASGT